MMKCAECGASIEDTPLYRGVKLGDVYKKWFCEEHVPINPDEDVKELCTIISEENRRAVG